MSWLSRLLRHRQREPSAELQQAQDARKQVLSQREEVIELTTSLRESVRKPNHLAPLIEGIIRNTR